MSDTNESDIKERVALLDFFRTQINTRATTIVTLVVALASQGIITYQLPKDLIPEESAFLRTTLLFGGVGFFVTLII